MTTGPRPSLTRLTLSKVAVRIAVVVVVATVISYLHVRNNLESQALEQLEEYVHQRGMRESAIFQLAVEDLHTFAAAYLRRVEGFGDIYTAPRFRQLFARREDGTLRLRERVYSQTEITGFIGKHVEIDEDLRRRLVIGYDLLTRYGPAWAKRFVNLYVTTPENAVLMYWPGESWGLWISDWEVNARLALTTGDEDVVLVLDENRPQPRQTTWSDLYFDYGVNDWVVSVTEPVHKGERYLISVGHDILLRELIDRTVNDRLEGTYNMILREDGRLIAHHRFMDAIQAEGGTLSIAEAGDPHMQRVYARIAGRAPGQTIIANESDVEYLAVTRLDGPGWLLVTVFPRAIVASRAFSTARLILLLGALALALELAILYAVFKRQVASPLAHLTAATNRVGAGQFDLHLDESGHGEIGQLAHSFNTMSREIGAREAALNERSERLAEVNAELQRELGERERAQVEVARQREILHQGEKLRALGSLLAGVAHELNNPLSVVVGRAIMLEEQLRNAPQHKSISKVRTAAQRCARIIKTFLAMARQQEPARNAVALRTVVAAALDITGFDMPRYDIELTTDIPDDLPNLCADADQLTQVFTNLFINARQALADREAPGRLTVRARFDRTANSIRIQVEDNGPGIAPEVATRVFEPFFTTKNVGKGTGLGLSVSRGIVEAHGGTMVLSTAAGGGTIFEMTVPIGTPKSAAGADTAAVIAEVPSTRILVVDDEVEVATTLTDMLRNAGHLATAVGSGREALQRLATAPFGVVVSDLRMPDMDGTALYRAIRERHPALASRVIFVTGDTLSESARRLVRECRCPLIEKPFVLEDVLRAIAGLAQAQPN